MAWKDEFPKENRYFETNNGILYHAEAIETMSKFPKKTFDAIITDPPYGTTACKWDIVIPFEDMWRELKRIRKDRTPIILFGSEPFSSYLRISNINEFRYDWIWEKEQGTNQFLVKIQPLRKTENITVFYKKQCKYIYQFEEGKKYKVERVLGCELYGNKKKIITENKGIRYPVNLLKFRRDLKNRYHPTQKPVALMEYLIKTYTKEGDLVLDFTCGSGTTLVACEKLNRRWVGIELEEKYCNITRQRLLKLLI